MRFILIFLVLLSLASCKHKEECHSNEKILRLNIVDDPISLDPRIVRSIKDITIVKHLFDGLMRVDANGIPQPALAKQVEISDDLMTYTFYLNKTYWTNGEPVTAYDFIYAWKSVLDPNFRTDYSYILYPIKNAKQAREGKCSIDEVGIIAVDPETLVVKLENPTPYFLELTAFPTYYPIHHQLDKQTNTWAHFPAKEFTSNGPFKLKKWAPQEEIVLVKNFEYWDEKNVHLHGISFSVISNSNTENLLFETDKLDWLGQPTSHNISTESIKKMKKNQQFFSYMIAGTFWFKFNTEKSPFNQVKIRQAFSRAINRQEIIEHILQGNQISATGPLPPSMQMSTTPYFQDGDIDTAYEIFEEVLLENGWTRDTFPKVVLSYTPSERNTKIVQLVQQQWKSVFNIDISLDGVEKQIYLNNIKEGLYQVGTGDWVADFNDPLAFLEIFKFRNQDGNGMNDTGWFNENFYNLLDRSVNEKNPSQRKKILAEAEKILIDEMPIAPIYHYAFDYAKKTRVKNVILSPMGSADFKFAIIE
ncbi:MAG: peptide ABC transporter substrate-binding protein [Chlamydiales bacterium]